MIYKFFCDDEGEHLIEIESSDAVAVEPEAIGKLLDEYRKGNAALYNINDWCEYLEKHGYAVRMFKPDYSMHFWIVRRDDMPKKKKVKLSNLQKSGWIVEEGKKGEKKKGVQTTFLDVEEV